MTLKQALNNTSSEKSKNKIENILETGCTEL